ncbi:hypothetical protein ACFV6F_35185 [Kitasatospora phosalacinea]|uniref:hypothetical protein n=1 Tax=Kitasatospora phosalacinea TaxID=2065 RepID=UPI003658C9EF
MGRLTRARAEPERNGAGEEADETDEVPQGGAGGVPDPDRAGDDHRAEGRPPTVRHGRRSEGRHVRGDATTAAPGRARRFRPDEEGRPDD